MNPNISLDQQPPDPEHIDTPPLTVVEFPNSDGIAFVKQEADAVEAVEPYTEEVLAEYEVECIMEKEIQRGKVYYLVKWKGFDMDHATWEPKSNLKNAPEILKEFEKNWRDAQQAAAEAALSSRTRKGANSAIAKVKREDSGNKAMIKKKEKVVVQQPEVSTNGLVVKIKKTTKDQNEEVFAFDEQSAEEAKVVEKPNESIKKKKVKELTKKVKLNPEGAQGKKKGKNGQITVKSENIFDPRDLMSHQMFMSMQKNGMLDGSIMGYHTDLSTHNMLDSIKKENIDGPNPSAFMTINMTHFAHQAISAGTRENSSSNNNSQGFPSNENSYNTTDIADTRIGISIHSKQPEKDNNFAALAKGMERQRLVDYSDSSYSSSPDVSDSESVQDTDMEASTISPYGSLESGDIPIKVIGIRPLIEENDLEIMMAWKPRPNGEKPEDSRVKRFDLLKRGLIMPLIEYYEQNMQLGSAPSFNASILAKKIV